MKKLEPTEIKEFYTLVDNNKGRVIGDFDSLYGLEKFGEAYCRRMHHVHFKDIYYFSKTRTEFRVQTHLFLENGKEAFWWGWTRLYNLYVTDSRGNLIDAFPNRKKPVWHWTRVRMWENNNYREWHEKRQQLILSQLAYRKDNINKTKPAYRGVLRSTWGDEPDYTLDGSYFRSVKTLQERRLAVNVLKEEGEPEFRGRRRILPSSYDDVDKGVWDTHKSWKHNSKRRKQWKPKAST